jgi:hypothetical protein
MIRQQMCLGAHDRQARIYEVFQYNFGWMFRSLDIRIWDLPFDLAQGGEPVEPFVIWCLCFEILLYYERP